MISSKAWTPVKSSAHLLGCIAQRRQESSHRPSSHRRWLVQ
jgi:hypothetical protein